MNPIPPVYSTKEGIFNDNVIRESRCRRPTGYTPASRITARVLRSPVSATCCKSCFQYTGLYSSNETHFSKPVALRSRSTFVNGRIPSPGYTRWLSSNVVLAGVEGARETREVGMLFPTHN